MGKAKLIFSLSTTFFSKKYFFENSFPDNSKTTQDSLSDFPPLSFKNSTQFIYRWKFKFTNYRMTKPTAMKNIFFSANSQTNNHKNSHRKTTSYSHQNKLEDSVISFHGNLLQTSDPTTVFLEKYSFSNSISDNFKNHIDHSLILSPLSISMTSAEDDTEPTDHEPSEPPPNTTAIPSRLSSTRLWGYGDDTYCAAPMTHLLDTDPEDGTESTDHNRQEPSRMAPTTSRTLRTSTLLMRGEAAGDGKSPSYWDPDVSQLADKTNCDSDLTGDPTALFNPQHWDCNANANFPPPPVPSNNINTRDSEGHKKRES